MTLTSKMRRQSSSEMSAKGLAPKMPRLLTKTSVSGTWRQSPSAPAAEERSATTPDTRVSGARWRMVFTAAATRSSVRPLTITDAPSRASAEAIGQHQPKEADGHSRQRRIRKLLHHPLREGAERRQPHGTMEEDVDAERQAQQQIRQTPIQQRSTVLRLSLMRCFGYTVVSHGAFSSLSRA